MTKPLGFLNIPRKDPGYRPKKERLQDFNPVERVFNKEEIREQVSRCMECGIPFCHGHGCPVANTIPECNELVYENRWEEALALLLKTNPFPEFTGRICPAPCEASCVAALDGDAIAIRQMELAVIENGFKEGYMQNRLKPERRSGAVAVIGSGPAGLTVAEILNQTGYNVTVFDEAAKAGGILRYGIPNFKLDKQIVRRRIRLMKDEGIQFEMKVRVGEDISFNYLNERFQAICLCNGARAPRDLAIPGRELSGIHFAMDYLTCQNKIDNREYVNPDDVISASEKKVIVIGGGDTGSDCVGTALRQGAASVDQIEILPKPPPDRLESNPWPEWPNILRESSSHKEGGTRHWSVNTNEFTGENGYLVGLKCCQVEWISTDGRYTPVDVEGSDFNLDADLVLLALGFVGPARNKLVDQLDLKKDNRGNIFVDEGHQTSCEKIFAAGDMVSGQSLVVRAIADGIAAAHSIEGYLKARGLT